MLKSHIDPLAISIDNNWFRLGLDLCVVAVVLVLLVVLVPARVDAFHDDLLHGDDTDGAHDDHGADNLQQKKRLLLRNKN